MARTFSVIFFAIVVTTNADAGLSCYEGDSCEEDTSVQLLQQEASLSRLNGLHAKPVAIQVATTTTTPDPTGMKLNAVGDLAAFLSALIANVVAIVVFIFIFSFLRLRYPLIYSNNVLKDFAPKYKGEYPGDSYFGWMKFALLTPVEEAADCIGLDNALMLKFANLCMRILAIIGIPMICIMGALNYSFGGLAACDPALPPLEGCDRLSYLSFGNVLSQEAAAERGVKTPWLYWLHACCVWGVAFTVQVNVYKAQKEFLALRYKWLKQMPAKRANTIMVEGITENWRTDAKLKEFFELNIKNARIKQAYVVKDTSDLAPLVDEKKKAEAALHKAEAQLKHNNERPKVQESFMGAKVDAIEYFKKKIDNLKPAIAKEQQRIAGLAGKVEGGVTLHNGFVEFEDKYYAELALNINYTEDNDEWCTSVPPAPADILWADLTQDPTAQRGRTVIGYALVAGLYFAYMPMVIGITNIAKVIDMGPLQPVWQGLAPTLGLQFMVAMLPTFLVLIFQFFFTLKAEAWAQTKIQRWYYVFQVFFVILATSVGQDVKGFTNTLVTDPFASFGVLARTMPYATHFYMNFLVLSWVTHFMNMLRYVPLMKFKAALLIFEEEEAREMAEPEDQDYYGIGSRAARWAIMMNVGIVFGTLSPPICFLTFVNFFVCRFVYGYLICFAETKKADLGGEFWVSMMRHLFIGNIIYCVLMTGVFMERADTWGPVIIAAPSIFYVIWSMQRFETAFAWEKLPNTEVVHIDALTGGQLERVKPTPEETVPAYEQPELQ